MRNAYFLGIVWASPQHRKRHLLVHQSAVQVPEKKKKRKWMGSSEGAMPQEETKAQPQNN